MAREARSASYTIRGFAKGVGTTLYFISVRDGFFLFSLFFYIIFSNVERAVHIADARARLHARSRGIRNAIRPA